MSGLEDVRRGSKPEMKKKRKSLIAFEMKASGKSFPEIALKMGAPVKRIYSYVSREKNYDEFLTRQRLRNRKCYGHLPRDERDRMNNKKALARQTQVSRMRKSGLSYAEIADQLGTTRNVIAGICNRAKLSGLYA